MGNKPKAISEIEGLEMLLSRAIARKGGKQFLPIIIPPATETEKANPIFMREFELANKINEIIYFLNNRYPVG